MRLSAALGKNNFRRCSRTSFPQTPEPLLDIRATSPCRKIASLLSPDEFERLCVVMVATRNPLNLGAAARAMSNFGFQRLRVVHPYELAFREARSAVGAASVLRSAEEFRTIAEAIADCALVVGTTAGRGREIQHPLHSLPAGARLIRKKLNRGRVALLFGSEKRGLSNHDLSHCHFLLQIPTREDHPSMNLGQAVAVCLYELARSSKSVVSGKLETANAAVMERITQLLLEALGASGYLTSRVSSATEEKIRRLVRRLNLPASDAELWLGIWRQVAWRLRQENRS